MKINSEIEQIKNIIIATVPDTKQIYLFGSYAKGTATENSDYDFYVVIKNDASMTPMEATGEINCAIYYTTKKPVDMIVGSEAKFDRWKEHYSIEKEVMNTGVKLYESEDYYG